MEAPGPGVPRLQLGRHLGLVLDLYRLMLQLKRLGLKLGLLQLLRLDVKLLRDLRHRDKSERHGHGLTAGHSGHGRDRGLGYRGLQVARQRLGLDPPELGG